MYLQAVVRSPDPVQPDYVISEWEEEALYDTMSHFVGIVPEPETV
jgi:hypothetical protein